MQVNAVMMMTTDRVTQLINEVLMCVPGLDEASGVCGDRKGRCVSLLLQCIGGSEKKCMK